MLGPDPIELDTGTHMPSVCGSPIELSAKEYPIVEHRMVNSGRLLSRGQIIDHVWSFDFEGGRSLIEVDVSRLRHETVEAGGPDPSVTIRGAGCRFQVPKAKQR